MLAVFDLDGTLFDVAPGIDYDSPASVLAHARPHVGACERVRDMARVGWRIIYLSGRSEGVRGATLAQIEVARLPWAPVFLQVAFRGMDEMALWKASILCAVRAAVYVGDTWADEEAAARAGVRFVHADEFRARGVSREVVA
jgi:phosphoglycolate phosphatase-like HAD superfamily hydrolase